MVILPSLPILKSYEIPELLNPLSWQMIPCHFQRRLILEHLPFNGVHMILGNDLAGGNVDVYPLLTSTPCVDQPLDAIQHEVPCLYLFRAVTRAIAKKAK